MFKHRKKNVPLIEEGFDNQNEENDIIEIRSDFDEDEQEVFDDDEEEDEISITNNEGLTELNTQRVLDKHFFSFYLDVCL